MEPSMNTGINLEREYQMALGMFHEASGGRRQKKSEHTGKLSQIVNLKNAQICPSYGNIPSVL